MKEYKEFYAIYRDKEYKSFDEIKEHPKVMRIIGGGMKSISERMRMRGYRILDVFSLEKLMKFQKYHRSEFNYYSKRQLIPYYYMIKEIHFDKFYETYTVDKIPTPILK